MRDGGDDIAGTDQRVQLYRINLGHSIQSCVWVVWHMVEEESPSAPLEEDGAAGDEVADHSGLLLASVAGKCRPNLLDLHYYH